MQLRITTKVKSGYSVMAGIFLGYMIPDRILRAFFINPQVSHAYHLYIMVALFLGITWTAYHSFYRPFPGSARFFICGCFGLMLAEGIQVLYYTFQKPV
jgi:hypothetical protein